MNKNLSIRKIASIGVLGALGGILMIIDFPIFIAPSFYKLDLGDLPCLIGSFAMGPTSAFFIQLVKIIVKLLIKPTSTAFVGEIAAFCFSTIFCVSASIIYKNNHNKKGAIKAMAIASLIYVLFACLGNYFVIIPAYVELYKMPLEAIISAGTQIFPIIHNKLSFVIYCVMPFNLIKIVIIDILTLILYKRISPLLNRYK